MLKQDIRKKVQYYVKKYETNDPFKLAKYLGVLVQFGNIDFEGCYMFLKNHRYIFLNQNLEENELRFVMAHELGHALLHRKINCYFIKNQTLLLNSKIEIEANKFATELLIPEDKLIEYKEFTISQLATLFGYNEELIKLRLK